MLIALPALLFAAPCPPDGAVPLTDYEDQAKAAWQAGPPTRAGRGGVAGEPSLVGQWLEPTEWPVIAIHAAVLPTGRVLHYSYPSGTPGSKAMVYDPQSGLFEDVSMSTDIFCSGHSFLADGHVLVTGGNDTTCTFQGRVTTFTFDPFALTWTGQESMSDGRWYPTNLTLGDGRALIVSGLSLECDANPVMEMFTPGAGISIVDEGMAYLPLYPRLHLLSDGRVALVGEVNEAHTFALGAGWQYVATSNAGWRSQGTSVRLPGFTDRIMILGGYVGDSGPTATCEIIDFADPVPSWQYTAPMHHARAHANALILPDATVFVCGGGRFDLYEDPVYVPELYDPVAGTWTEVPEHVFGRMYHSTMVLLPDGRVLMAGQDNGPSQFWGEVYEPPYLFRGQRPVIDAAPGQIVYGQSFPIETAQAPEVAAVALIRLSSVTHSVNFEQRYVGLSYTAGGSALLRSAPVNPNVAPPGYYMLFIANGLSVPSVARIVRLAPAHPADVNQDGSVGVADLVAVILAWGPCPPVDPCPPDVTGDGEVDVSDLTAVIVAWTGF